MTSDPEHLATCACGQLRITAKGEPDIVVACSCTACQRRTGSPFGVAAYYPRGKILSTEGESRSFDRAAEAGRSLSNKFCPDCGTSVYWTLDMRPDHIGIAIGCFADPGFTQPARAVWSETKHHWMDFPDDIPSFPKAAP